MALLEISCIPVGTDQGSYSSLVTEACRIAARAGVKYQVTPTSTVLEGDMDQLLGVAAAMHKAAFGRGVPRVVSNIVIDERRDRSQSMERAVAAVSDQLH